MHVKSLAFCMWEWIRYTQYNQTAWFMKTSCFWMQVNGKGTTYEELQRYFEKTHVSGCDPGSQVTYIPQNFSMMGVVSKFHFSAVLWQLIFFNVLFWSEYRFHRQSSVDWLHRQFLINTFGVCPQWVIHVPKQLHRTCFAREFLQSGKHYRPGQRLKRCVKSSSMHSKKILAWGMWIFCEFCHKLRTFRPPWPTSPGPGHQPLDGSISLKFFCKTRLQAKSFDTLDDLLGFQVQKLWPKVIKMFD